MAVTRKGLITVACAIAISTIGVGTANTVNNLNDKVEQLTNQVQQQKKDVEKYEDRLDKKQDELTKTKNGLEKLEQDYNSLQSEYNKYKNSVSYNPSNIRQKSNVSAEQLQIALKDTGLRGLEGSFVQAEKQYGVNAIMLTSLVANESGYGTSRRAKDDNNLSGYCVYGDDAPGTKFSSKHESIMQTAKLLSENYLKPSGKHFNGYGLRDVNINYSQLGSSGEPNYDWSRTINSIANDLQEDINSKRAV